MAIVAIFLADKGLFVLKFSYERRNKMSRLQAVHEGKKRINGR